MIRLQTELPDTWYARNLGSLPDACTPLTEDLAVDTCVIGGGLAGLLLALGALLGLRRREERS